MIISIYKCVNTGFAPLGKLIRWQQGTDFSHFAIGFQSISGNQMVLDATSKNVALRPIERFMEQYKIVSLYQIELDTTDDEFMGWYEEHLGESYGYMQLLGILIKNKSLGHGIICNELVMLMLQRFTKAEINDINIRDLKYTDKIIKEYLWA